MLHPRNFVGVVGHGGPSCWQSFSNVTFLGPSNPLSRLSQRQSGAHLLAACPAHNDRVVKDKSYAVGRATTALRLADLADRRVDRTTPDCSSRHCYAHVLTTRNPKQSCAASDHARVCAARRPPNTQHASCGRRQRHADSSCRLTSARPKAYQ